MKVFYRSLTLRYVKRMTAVWSISTTQRKPTKDWSFRTLHTTPNGSYTTLLGTNWLEWTSYLTTDTEQLIKEECYKSFWMTSIPKTQLSNSNSRNRNGLCLAECRGNTKANALYSNFSEKTSILVKKAISSSGLDMGLRNRQGKPLRSRLAFQQLSADGTCTKKKCPINDQSICYVTGCVYIVTCLFRKQYYVGSTTRPFHQRAAEHLRAAKNPASYKEDGLAEHYATSHPTSHEPSLKFALLRREKDLLRLRHTEAIMIDEMQSKLNRKSEGASFGLLIVNYTHSPGA